jgi:hypothetical protein
MNHPPRHEQGSLDVAGVGSTVGAVAKRIEEIEEGREGVDRIVGLSKARPLARERTQLWTRGARKVDLRELDQDSQVTAIPCVLVTCVS